ncbi:L96 [Symbiodinium sp. CCMP2592]|nr:L96 [Symbiodinium sp. CCMP2592]
MAPSSGGDVRCSHDRQRRKSLLQMQLAIEDMVQLLPMARGQMQDEHATVRVIAGMKFPLTVRARVCPTVVDSILQWFQDFALRRSAFLARARDDLQRLQQHGAPCSYWWVSGAEFGILHSLHFGGAEDLPLNCQPASATVSTCDIPSCSEIDSVSAGDDDFSQEPLGIEAPSISEDMEQPLEIQTSREVGDIAAGGDFEPWAAAFSERTKDSVLQLGRPLGVGPDAGASVPAAGATLVDVTQERNKTRVRAKSVSDLTSDVSCALDCEIDKTRRRAKSCPGHDAKTLALLFPLTGPSFGPRCLEAAVCNAAAHHSDDGDAIGHACCCLGLDLCQSVRAMTCSHGCAERCDAYQGFACHLCAGKVRCHDPHVGERIGEAAHPGPGPRAEDDDDDMSGLLGGLDLKKMLLPLLKKLIKQALEDLLKDETHLSRATKVQARGNGRGTGDAAQAAQPSRIVQTVATEDQALPGGRGAAVVAFNKLDAKTPKVGKGKGASHSPKEERAWTVVSRRAKDQDEAFQLRSQDWDAPLLSFSGLGNLIEKTKTDETVKGVLLASKADCNTALRMLQSAAKPFSVLLVCLGKGPGSQRIPGRVGDSLRFRDALVEQHSSDASFARPAPKDLKCAPKVKQLQTSLLYVRIPHAFASEQTWKDFKNGAERASMKWISSHHVQGIDSFAWVEEQLKNAPGTQLFGIMRAPTADVGTLLGTSGQHGIFVEPAKRDTHRFRMEWIPRLSKQETHDHYLQRALRGAPALGLAAFGQRVAWRHPLSDGEVPPRVWAVNGLPNAFNAHDMLPVLEQGFKEITLLSHRRKKGQLSVRFRATCLAGDKDLVPIQVAVDEGDPVCLWAMIAPARSVESRQKPLARGAVPFVSPAKTTSLDAKPNLAAGTEATAVDDQGKAVPDAKRARGAARTVPDGMQRQECPKDGNCAFTSFALALNWIYQKSGSSAFNHLELRAKVATHLAKHSDEYQAEWDGVLPDGTKDKAWDDYLTAAAQAGSFASELELRALGRIFDTRILILPASECFKPMVFHTSQKKRLAVSWLQDKHLEFLKPSKDNSACKDYPEEFWQVTDGPVKGIRAGGKPSSCASSVASPVGSVFTRDAAPSARTVWTEPRSSGCKRDLKLRVTAAACDTCKVSSGSSVTGSKRSRGEPGAAWTSSRASCASNSVRIDSLQDDLEDAQTVKVHAASKTLPQSPLVQALRARGRSCSDGIARCRLCPFRKKCRSQKQASRALCSHFAACHQGERPCPVKRLESCVRLLVEDEPAYWKCKWCDMGIAAADAEKVGENTLTRFRNDHKTAAHPRLSWAKWHRRTRRPAQFKDNEARARKVSATKRNAYFVAKLLPVTRELESRDFVPFLWPRLAGSRSSKIDRYPLRFKPAWRCTRCNAPFQDAKVAQEHRDKAQACPSSQSKRMAQTRLQSMEEYRKLHDQAPASAKKQQGDIVFDTALVHLRASLPASDPSHIIALSEVDVPETAGVGFLNQWKARGRQAALSVPEPTGCRVALVSEVPPGDSHDAHEVSSASTTETILVVAFYGQASDEAVAQSQVEDVLSSAEATGFRYVILGDFNSILCRHRGLAFAGDDCACGRPLPSTGPPNKHGVRVRRIDFALNHRRLCASAVDSFDCAFSDHLGVHYTYAIDAPAPLVGPRRRPARADLDKAAVATLCDKVDPAPLEEALVQMDLDGAWAFLSDVAEQLLCEPAASGCVARGASWHPREPANVLRPGKRPERSRGLRLLLKLQERLRVLTFRPADEQLAVRIRKSLRQIRLVVPELAFAPAGSETSLLPQVEELVAAYTRQEEEAKKLLWRARIRADTARVRAFVKRRADEQIAWESRPPDAAAPGDNPHPAVAVKTAAAALQNKIAPRAFAPVNTHAVRAMLQAVPRPAAQDSCLEITPEGLVQAMRAMCAKAPGPDQWHPHLLLILPMRWWCWAARLWNLCLRGRCAFHGGFRPLTIAQVMWRAGARVINQQLASWVSSWASQADAGGLPGTSVQSALLQLSLAMNQGAQTVIQQDIASFFDTIQHGVLEIFLDHLRAPALLWPILRAFYQKALRIVQLRGAFSSSWFRPVLGLAQGCPLSPTLAAAISHIWAQVTLRGGVSGIVYLDDRSIWSHSNAPDELRAAVLRSNHFDSTCGLAVSLPKCAVVASQAEAAGADAIASEFGYQRPSSLEILGVTVDFEAGWGLLKFSLRKALLRLRLLRWTCAHPRIRMSLLSALVFPCLTWAAAFALPSAKDMTEIRAEVVRVFDDSFSFEAPKVLIFELLGWMLEPQCAAEVAVLREIWRLLCAPPAFASQLPRRGADIRWDQLLPAASPLLTRLGWWISIREEDPFLCRRDDQGCVRSVHVGWEHFAVIREWLFESYRQMYTARCQRVWKSFHRADPTLARGLDLGPPPEDARFRFQGHVIALQESDSRYMRRAAAASGGSCWFFNAGNKFPVQHARMTCSCGAAGPSRPHVTWVRASNADLRHGHPMPATRAEERLFARPTPQMPAAPVSSDVVEFDRSLDAAVLLALQPGEHGDYPWAYIATDLSSERSVGAFAVVVGKPSQRFAAGTGSEDQAAYRQEALALHAALASLSRVWQAGMKTQVFLVTDCLSAMQSIMGDAGALGSLPLLMQSARSLLRGLGTRGCLVSFIWVPSHGKNLRWQPPSGHCAHELREMNRAADVAAGECMGRRLSGSCRSQWHQSCDEARVPGARRAPMMPPLCGYALISALDFLVAAALMRDSFRAGWLALLLCLLLLLRVHDGGAWLLARSSEILWLLLLSANEYWGQASPKSSSLAADSYALDTDETQVVQGPTDDDDVILVEPHMNPLQEIEISEAMTDTQEIVVAAELPGSTASKVSNTIPGKIIFKKKRKRRFVMICADIEHMGWWLKQTPKTSVPEVSAASPVSKTAAEKTKKPKTPIKSPDPAAVFMPAAIILHFIANWQASPVEKTAAAQERKKPKTPIKSPDPEAVFMAAAIFFI